MRYVSEQFKAKQDEIIRPATRLHFEVGTNVVQSLKSMGNTLLDFDTSVAPIVAPNSCTNEYYYAALGDGMSVDDPKRLCSPEISYTKPNHSVPYGITEYANNNTWVIIGNDSVSSFNFKGITSPITLNFGGGVLPDALRVEYYDDNSDTWHIAKEYTSPLPTNEFTFTPDNYDADTYYRFEVRNITKSGRFQLNWIRAEKTATPVVFSDNHISVSNIDESTDLTSQSMPSYEMTVECLDVNGEYSPETAYWDNQFKDGSPCFLKAGYKINDSIEYIPIMFGKLTERPDYEQGKITFKVAVDWRIGWTFTINPYFDENLNVGDDIPGDSFGLIIFNGKLFDTYDFDSTECNYSGEIDSKDARQLVANAMGCFIKAGFNSVDLISANSIQYRSFDDYLTRYDQVRCALESKPKVGKISVTRNANTVASEYVEIEYPNAAEVGRDAQRYVIFPFELPFFATGKWELIDAQSTNPDAVVSLFNNPDVKKLDNGNFIVAMPFTASEITTIKPIVRFYKAESNQFEETETLTDSVEGDIYTNDNMLITNSEAAGKVKRVAHLVSDISSQYEVDVVQDLRYEGGDIIRLETEKGVYKTCVITDVKFRLPGSSGHITCRKIFSFEDSDKAVFDPVGLSVSFGVTNIEVTKASERAGFVGIMHTPITTHIFVMGVEEYDEDISGTVTQETYNGMLTDLNEHEWKFAYYSVPSGTIISTDAPVVDLPEYDISSGVSEGAYGAISLLKKIYSEQGMSAPVDYNCDWEEF
ncbi:MAG: hypothetical protein IKH75_11675 [Ruminococcus sp.]|nr:hypothetical protein [Ruminococcus sp.]